MNFIVLSSSRGTTFQAVLDRIEDGSLTARCLGLIADREDRGCVSKARAAGVAVTILERMKGEDREEYDRRVHGGILSLTPPPPNPLPHASLRSARERGSGSTVIAALGWMFIFSPWFVHQWRHRIINVHPALLPKHAGGQAIRETLAAGETETGMTIHLIDEGVDTGPILLQKKCPVLAGDTEDTLKERVQALEKEWYPKVLQMIERGEMILPKT